jgi:hypothetical protein
LLASNPAWVQWNSAQTTTKDLGTEACKYGSMQHSMMNVTHYIQKVNDAPTTTAASPLAVNIAVL